MFKLDSEKLKPLMLDTLQSLGVRPDVTEDVAEALVQTSLRGTDSHGINLFPHYCNVSNTGRINRDPQVSFTRNKQVAALMDGDHGYGHYVGRVGMQEAIKIAKDSGIGAVAIKNSTHFAAAAYYGLQAAREGMIGLAFTNADALVKAPGATKAFFGTNPICFCAPMAGEDPFCLDMATSQISWNRIVNHRRVGTAVEVGLAFNEKGLPETEADLVRTLSPTGDYKGFGLGMMVEILCGMLTGGPAATELTAMYTKLEEKRSISHFMMAINIESFLPVQDFAERLKNMAEMVRALPTLPDSEGSKVPGDPEKATYEKRRKEGIPVDPEKFDEFRAVNPSFAQARL